METGQGREWACEFPPEADEAGINDAYVAIAVEVRPEGKAGSVSVLAEPGYGFGRAAAACARMQHYVVARDAQGRAVSEVVKLRVHFVRDDKPPRSQ
jgi:protein TonB